MKKSSFMIYDPSTREKIAEFTAPTHHKAAVKMAGRGKKRFFVRKAGEQKVKVFKGTLTKGPVIKVVRVNPEVSKARRTTLRKKFSDDELVKQGLAKRISVRKNKVRAYYEESLMGVKLVNEMTRRNTLGRRKSK